MAWRQDPRTGVSSVFQRTYDMEVAGAWSPIPAPDERVSVSGSPTSFVDAAVGGGQAIVVWGTGSQDERRTYAGDYGISTAGWTTPADSDDAINPRYAEGTSNEPRVAMNDSGDAVIVFDANDGGDSTMNAFVIEVRDGVWTYPVDVRSGIGPGSGDNDNMVPHVAIDTYGHSVVAWMNSSYELYYDAGYYSIMVSEYR